MTWSHNGEKLEVNYRGDVEFSDDDKDIKSLTPGGWLRIKDGGWLGGHTMEFRADASGKIERRFWTGSREQPFEPEGRKWLEQVLPRFIRQTGMGARARVARIYKTKGAPGVLAEVSLIEGSWAKRIYLAELLRTPGLDARTVEQAFAQAGREIDSDFELASLLISAGDLLTADATRRAYFDAARTIGSDFEMRRVFSSALKRGPLAPAFSPGFSTRAPRSNPTSSWRRCWLTSPSCSHWTRRHERRSSKHWTRLAATSSGAVCFRRS